MKAADKGLIESTMAKYGIPPWAKPYIYRYASRHPLSAIKHAKSFVDVRRKRGEVTSKYVKLPNGIAIELQLIARLASMFFYSEKRMIEITNGWFNEVKPPDGPGPYAKHFEIEMEAQAKRLRALNNLAAGLNLKIDQNAEQLRAVYDYLASLTDWRERIIATNMILRYSYAKSFGFIFYKMFYPVSPELMRTLGKAFAETENSRWGENEAQRIVRSAEIPQARLIEITVQLLARIYRSIEDNRTLAAKAGMVNEVELLRDIAIAYPLHAMKELGVEINVDKEVGAIRSAGSKIS